MPPTTGPLHPCGNQLCDRLLGGGAKYCCFPCSHADENRYEIHGHTEPCDERWAQRSALRPEAHGESASSPHGRQRKRWVGDRIRFLDDVADATTQEN